jgi:cytochrome c biogenesis protein CcmG/thiol:disulfide interchange protein DsbE
MSRVSPFMLAPPLIFAALAAMFYLGMNREDPDALPSARIGQVAPPLTTEPLGGEPAFDAATLSEPGVKLVNFWASWCAPCRAEHPNIEALAKEGVPIYGVNYKDDPDKALAFLSDLGNPYAAIGADTSGRTGIDWGLYGVPETFVINSEGKITFRFPGPVTKDVLEKKLRPAMDAAE